MGRAGAGEASSSSNMTRSDGWTPETASALAAIWHRAPTL